METRGITRLKQRRQEIGMTQQEVIERTGVSRVSYHRYENGEREPTASTANHIADVLGTTVEALWGGNSRLLP